jgi:hypothetical protein
MRPAVCSALAALAVVLVAACGNATVAGPGSVVSSYLAAVAEGNYGSACGLLERSVQTSLETRFPRRTSCAKVVALCLPNKALALARDQVQQFYANVDVTYANGGKGAVALVNGTTVARTVKRVTLRQKRGTWRLTSPGVALKNCHR